MYQKLELTDFQLGIRSSILESYTILSKICAIQKPDESIDYSHATILQVGQTLLRTSGRDQYAWNVSDRYELLHGGKT